MEDVKSPQEERQVEINIQSSQPSRNTNRNCSDLKEIKICKTILTFEQEENQGNSETT